VPSHMDLDLAGNLAAPIAARQVCQVLAEVAAASHCQVCQVSAESGGSLTRPRMPLATQRLPCTLKIPLSQEPPLRLGAAQAWSVRKSPE
jgi:hypothetical protein